MSNILDVISNEFNMATLKKGIIASGFAEVLESVGPYTFFAPSDLAFEKLHPNTLTDLMLPENKVRLTNLLRNHTVAGKLNYIELKNADTIQTLQGKVVRVAESWGKKSVGSAIIQNRDLPTSNGVVHALDTVLLP